MSVFTDEDLKRLKKDIKEAEEEAIRFSASMRLDAQKALLARLEAAEAVASYANYDEVPETIKEAWRKAAGRE